MWGLPSVIVVVMAIVTWDATHKLNPYKPLESEVKPLDCTGCGNGLEMAVHLSRN